jgi:ATP-dependent RNA helicase RhlE
LSFNSLQLIEPVLKALSDEGYTKPTAVQEQSIPVILKQRDLLGCAQTGTGKTAAFAIPILQLLHQQSQQFNEKRRTIRALILTPTRELAIQVGESFKAYGKYLPLKHLVLFGGVSQSLQVEKLRQGTDILVSTPGRLIDLHNQGHLSLNHIKCFVLDEADHMLDMGFIHDVKKIISKLPAQRQTLFFSATMPPEIQKLTAILLRQPVKVEVTPVSTTVDLIQQSLFYVDKQNKRSLLVHLLKDENIKTALVFTRTKHGADKVAKDLTKAGIKAEAIHGNKSQNARQAVLANFKNGKSRVLVATDIAARGIDIDSMGYVFNFELPNVPETYVHRIGRTGRAGASGMAISFCDHEEQIYLKDIQKLTKQIIPVVKGHAFDTIYEPGMEKKYVQPSFSADRRLKNGMKRNQKAFQNSKNNNRNRDNHMSPERRQRQAGAFSTTKDELTY